MQEIPDINKSVNIMNEEVTENISESEVWNLLLVQPIFNTHI